MDNPVLDALVTVWEAIQERHNLPPSCATEVDLDAIDEKYHGEIESFITLWDTFAE